MNWRDLADEYATLRRGFAGGWTGKENSVEPSVLGIAGATLGTLGRYAYEPVRALQTLSGAMDKARQGKLSQVNPLQEVTIPLAEIGMLSGVAGRAPKGSLRTFAGRNAKTADFDNWFSNSKVVDNEGKPLVVYHGSPESFQKFKPFSHFGTTPKAAQDRIKMITDKETSGSIYPVYLHIKNPWRVQDLGVFSPFDVMGAFNEGKVPEMAKRWVNTLSPKEMRIIAKHLGFITDKKIINRHELVDSNNKFVYASQSRQLMDKEAKQWTNENAKNIFGQKYNPPYKVIHKQQELKPEKITKSKLLKEFLRLSPQEQTTAVFQGDIRANNALGDLDSLYDTVISDLKSEGFDGIWYRNEVEDKGSEAWIAFSPTQIKSVYNKGAFDPNDPNIL